MNHGFPFICFAHGRGCATLPGSQDPDFATEYDKKHVFPVNTWPSIRQWWETKRFLEWSS